MKVQKEKSIQKIKAPQAIVHIKHSISLRQYKLWVILLRKFRDCYESDEVRDEKGFFRISKEEIHEYLGYEPVKEELRLDFEVLRKEPIIINYLEKDGTPVMHGMGFISEWKISSKTVRFRIPSFLEDVMKGLDEQKAIFQLLNWEIFNQFSGKYEAIIYKLCRDYIGVKRTPYMTIQEFREYVGIKQKEYSEFMRLNQFIISGPCKKINDSAISDIEVSPEFKREGRKVQGLYFKVESKNQITIPFSDYEPNPAFQFSKITIEPIKQTEYLKIRSPEEISICIERVNEYAEEQEKIGKSVNYGAMYRTAIIEGWHIGYLEQKKKKAVLKNRVEQAKELQKSVEQHQQEEENKEKQKDQEIREEIQRVLSIFEMLSEKEKEDFRKAYLETLPEALRQAFEQRGEKSPMHRYRFVLFLKEQSVVFSKD